MHIVIHFILLTLSAGMTEPFDEAWFCEHASVFREQLFASLDLEQPEFNKIQAACSTNAWTKACALLLDYHAERWPHTAPPLEATDEESLADALTEANALLEGRFTFYRIEGRVPSLAHGGLDWTYQGPNQDREWAWALNRHRHLRILLDAYERSGDTRYVKAIDAHLRDWVLHSPYPGEKSNTAQWRGLEAALRIRPWAESFARLQHVPELTPATRLLMLASLPDHAHYLKKFHASRDNWLTMEMNALALLATTWPEYRNAKAWLAYAGEKLTPQIHEQVYPDGAQTELTSHYHRVAARNFQEFADTLDAVGHPVKEDFLIRLESMWNYLACTMKPDGTGLLNNDSDLDHNAPVVLDMIKRYERSDWAWIATMGAQGIPPETGPSVMFPWAGHAVMRTGWDSDAWHVFVDVGPLGTAHVHHDKLHLSLYAYGRDLLVDSGRYTYVGGPWRRYFTGSSAHNVLLVDGAGQRPYTGMADAPLDAESWCFSPHFDFVRGVFDGGYIGVNDTVQHERIVLRKGPAPIHIRNGTSLPEGWECTAPGTQAYLVVADLVTCQSAHDITALWHFHPECTVQQEQGHVVTVDEDKGNLRIIPAKEHSYELDLVSGRDAPDILGWYSPVYNVKMKTTAAVYTTRIEENALLVWLLLPARGIPPASPVISAERFDGHIAVRVVFDGDTTDKYVIPL